jgi:transposase
MAKIAKKTKRRPSDLTDREWAEIGPLTPKLGRQGRSRQVEFREVTNAVRCLMRSGCGWRMPPVRFGLWRTVYGWFLELAPRFRFQTIQRQGRVPGRPARAERNRVDAEQGRPTLRRRRRSPGDRGVGNGARRHVGRSVGRGGSPPLHRTA